MKIPHHIRGLERDRIRNSIKSLNEDYERHKITIELHKKAQAEIDTELRVKMDRLQELAELDLEEETEALIERGL